MALSRPSAARERSLEGFWRRRGTSPAASGAAGTNHASGLRATGRLWPESSRSYRGQALFFVALWTSGWRATLGMRLIGIRVLQAADAGVLPLDAAAVRWLALTGIVQLLAILPVAGGVFGLIALVWVIVLLATTATDRLRQGLHDRWAGSVVVQPAPGGSGAAVVGCVVLIALAFFVPFIVFLLVSDDLRDILSRVGTSI